ncbi:mRNA N(3)-methylcytidine methyltransferase METTL8 isoform X2 [Anabas testudineus]|uniref:mRNA N(3)-methylcytidine methyltransferase METTL8 isoform X2 n=1 Tax=Anabas testudineus TaxID=64144 RepID=UPI000E465D37|nr:mRNA N(3)-methylcytidine methyltransferase METTL8 isoform X2 [Anabas testudineus]
MPKLSRFSVAKLAKVFGGLSTRLKSTGGRPSAPLGSRFLTNPDDIFKHNMWDHVQWTEEEKQNARQRAEENSSVQIPLNEQGAKSKVINMYQGDQQAEISPPTASSMDTKTRHHQHSGSTHHRKNTSDGRMSSEGASLENNEAAIQTSAFPGQNSSYRIFEVGCGVGNSVFPIVNSIKETDAFLYCCDFSPRAIQLVKDHPDYDDSVCHAFVHDICEEMASFPFPAQSLDVILAVFVLSSIHPERMQGVVNRLSTYLKDGGIFLFRDYGRYDFSQLRFKKGRCLSENFYTRGDGTCVYFFTKEEVHNLFSKAGLEEIQNLEDRRLQVNRGRKVVMHRVWMQSKYRKSHPASPS